MVCDFHNHLVPGVDDGAPDLPAAQAGLGRLRDDGVQRLITTPHVMASLSSSPERLAERLAEIDEAWLTLDSLVQTQFSDLTVGRGAEVMLDTPEPDFSDPRLRLGGGGFVLVEFPYFQIPPRSAELMDRIRRQGYTPVVAHPERYVNVPSDLGLLRAWRQAGALLQLNGPSLLGRYGGSVERCSRRILNAGLADYLCSDYHARGRPDITAYRERLNRMGGAEHAHLLTDVNPQALLQGRPPIPVPALNPLRPGLLRRFFGP